MQGNVLPPIGLGRKLLLKSVVLVGMMGAGKTAIGKALAHLLDVPFLDSDAEIARAANMSIAEIFERDGEAFFRDRESEILERLLLGTPAILSTGGGAFLRDENQDMIARLGASVWLDAPLDLLWERVRHKNTRPLLRTANPQATLTEIYNTRHPIYARATIRFAVKEGHSIQDTSTRLHDRLISDAKIWEDQNA